MEDNKKDVKPEDEIGKNNPISDREKKDIPLTTFFKKTIRNYASLVLWVLPTYLGGRYLLRLHDDGKIPEIFGWRLFHYLQVFTTATTYYISRLFGIDVAWKGWSSEPWSTELVYQQPLGTVLIIPDCTAILEVLFITAIMMGFNLKMKVRQRLKWAGILSGIILVENQIRLVLNWPIAKAYGYDRWAEIHIFWWKTGQLIFVILLFIGWFALVGRKYSPFFEDDTDKKAPSPDPKKDPGSPSPGK